MLLQMPLQLMTDVLAYFGDFLVKSNMANSQRGWTEREVYCSFVSQSVSPLPHRVWCWEQSSVAVLSGMLQTLSEVDVPHLSVFKPEAEQFLCGWHGWVEESLVEKWPAGQGLHTVSLTGVPGRHKHKIMYEF